MSEADHAPDFPADLARQPPRAAVAVVAVASNTRRYR